jgi:hypothetical protein
MSVLDKDNILNDKTTIGDDYRDSIGLGMSKEKLLLFKMGDMKISAIICSDNYNDGWTAPKGIIVNCFTKVSANPDFSVAFGSKVKVYCPPGCADKSEAKVFGNA